MAGNYGWAIVAAMLVVQTVSSGLGFYNMSVYMAEFAVALDRPLADMSLAVSAFFVTGGVCGIFVARLLDRFDVRWIMIVGTLVAAAALGAMGAITQVWQVYALFVLFGAGNTCVSLVIATTLITRWFPGPNRSIALSIASTGLSLGGVTLTPLSAYLFNSNGVFVTMPWLGLAFALLILPVAFFVVRLPDDAAPEQQAVAADDAWRYGDAVRTRFFILLAAGYVLCMGSQVGGIAHLYGRVSALGGFEAASLAVQTLSVCSILGRFAGGVIVTRLSIRTFTLGCLALQVLGLGLLGYAATTWQAVLGAAVFGVSVGNLLMSQPLWLAEAFPGAVYPRVFAMANALSVAGVALGPYVMGLTVDHLDYLSAFLVAAVLAVLAGIVFAGAGLRPALPGTNAAD